MRYILAALDASSSAGTVLDTALRVGRLTDTVVLAVHVKTDTVESVKAIESIAEQAGVTLRIVDGVPESALTDLLDEPEMMAAVIGGRARFSLTEPRTGQVARVVLEQTNKPVVMVRDNTETFGEIHRILVPLEGSDTSSRPVLERLVPLVVDDVEMVVLHVFTPATVPAMLDQPMYDLDTLGREFLSRHFPHAGGIEFRAGSVVEQVVRLSLDRHMDLIVLSWSRNCSPERALVVRGVLDGSSRPVLLLPSASAGDDSSKDASGSVQG